MSGDGEVAEVVVVGGGLSGLLCARELRRAGYETRVLDAADASGGRVRTDVVDGFRCDRGFQLLNPAYPAVRRHVDLAALELRRFDRGVQVLTDDGLATVADPVRHPALLPATLRSGYLRPRELARLGAWLAPALGPVDRLLAGPDTTLTGSLDDARVEGRLRREVLEPFLTGVLAEDTGDASATFVRLLLRSFVRATPALPAGGMQALPDQLARGSSLTTGVRVARVRPWTAGWRSRATSRCAPGRSSSRPTRSVPPLCWTCPGPARAGSARGGSRRRSHRAILAGPRCFALTAAGAAADRS